jgi:hypothetical protein
MYNHNHQHTPNVNSIYIASNDSVVPVVPDRAMYQATPISVNNIGHRVVRTTPCIRVSLFCGNDSFWDLGQYVTVVYPAMRGIIVVNIFIVYALVIYTKETKCD